MRSASAVRGVVLALAMSIVPAVSHAGIFITIAPPPLPVYAQPVIPAPGYLWTPGYWAYGPEGYFWVPGVWVEPPTAGVLWTPGYWGWRGGQYLWNAGYWGPHVGFYGGVNYGFGYGGVGFFGGRWAGGVFSYNAAVMNVGGVGFIHNSYRENVVVNNIHTSFNGGAGGLRAMPTAGERMAMNEHHFGPTGVQNAHHEAMSHDRGQLASVNHGRPSNMAMSRPGAGGGHSAAPMNHGGAPANHGAPAGHAAPMNHSAPASHAAPMNHSAPAGGGHAAPAGRPAPGGGNKGGGGKPAGHEKK